MLKLYHVPRTRSARIIWLLEELADVPYQVELLDFVMPNPNIHAQKTPTGKLPTITDGNITMFESGAIIDFILERYGKGRLVPSAGTQAWAMYRQWSAFAEGTAAIAVSTLLWYAFMEADAPHAPPVIEKMTGWAQDNINAASAGLADQPYFAGDDFTAADVMMGYTMHMWKNSAGIALPDNLQAYFDNLQARPAFQKAMSG